MGTKQDHYFRARQDVPSVPHQVTVPLDSGSFTLATDSGVFSRERLDPGTRVLLELMPLPDGDGDVLDLGCGYGPIAFSIALSRPEVPVWAVDVNTRALDLVRRNADTLGVNNVRACLPDEVPGDVRFSRVYSNPPIRIGKAALHELLSWWLPLLSGDSAAYLVVQRNLGADSLAKWLESQGFRTERIGSRRGYRVFDVRSLG
ncbi:MAG: class I SAM-dependent methyltransferase [Sciscionella sp.]